MKDVFEPLLQPIMLGIDVQGSGGIELNGGTEVDQEFEIDDP